MQDRFSSSDLAMILPAFAGKVKRTLSRAAPLPQKQPYATAPPGQIKIKLYAGIGQAGGAGMVCSRPGGGVLAAAVVRVN